jgi:hypothetical protein
MTNSGVTNATSIRKLDAFDPRPRQRASPMASATPIGDATSILRTASLRLWFNAKRSQGSWSTDSAASGEPAYHQVEKPCQLLRDRPALNENCIAMATGIKDQSTYKAVTKGKKRGFPQGLAKIDLMGRVIGEPPQSRG